MKLNYSLHYREWEHLWIDGFRPLPKRTPDKIKFTLLSAKAPANFPRNFNEMGDLLTTERSTPMHSFYATLLLSYPISSGEWGDIRVALPLEAIKQIRTFENDDEVNFELELSDVEFIDVTPRP